MIKAVIFDLDGTLVTFTLDVKACRTKVIHHLTEQGCPQTLFSMKETAFDMLKKVKKHLTMKGTEKQQYATLEKKIFSIVESCELEAAKTTEMFPGIPETLQALRDMKLKIGLCTISGEKATNSILSRFGIERFFDAVIPRESVSDVKPNPVHLEAALDALGVKSQEAVFVGDSVKDVGAAVPLKVLAVGVTTGLSSIEELSRAGAHYLASSATDVPTLIKELNRESGQQY